MAAVPHCCESLRMGDLRGVESGDLGWMFRCPIREWTYCSSFSQGVQVMRNAYRGGQTGSKVIGLQPYIDIHCRAVPREPRSRSVHR